MTPNFSVETEHGYSYVNYPRCDYGLETPNQEIIGVFDTETEPWHTSDIDRRSDFFACELSVWGDGAKWKKTCKSIT